MKYQTQKSGKKIPFVIATRKIKYLWINLTKEVKDLYTENYTTLKKEIKEDKLVEAYTVFMGWNNYIIKMSMLPKAIYRFNTIPLKIAMRAWLVWLSGLSAGLQTKHSTVQFPVRGYAWVAGQVRSPVGGAWEATTHWCFSPSLCPSLLLCLK